MCRFFLSPQRLLRHHQPDEGGAEKYGLTDTVDLSAAFCLGKCTHGVSIKVDDEIVTGLNRDNFDDIFAGSVLAKLGRKPE